MNAKNFVSETCTCTGLGDITLTGAHPGARTFSLGYTDGENDIPVRLEELNAAGAVIAWEFSSCTFIAASNRLVRDNVRLSSNANSPVSFGGGSKRAFVFLPAEASSVTAHVNATEPHPAYDDMQSLSLIFENALV